MWGTWVKPHTLAHTVALALSQQSEMLKLLKCEMCHLTFDQRRPNNSVCHRWDREVGSCCAQLTSYNHETLLFTFSVKREADVWVCFLCSYEPTTSEDHSANSVGTKCHELCCTSSHTSHCVKEGALRRR